MRAIDAALQQLFYSYRGDAHHATNRPTAGTRGDLVTPALSDAPGSGPWGAIPPAPDLTARQPVYDGKLGELYGIYLRHLVWMVMTFGLSRFWGRTRLRRYLWSHLSILGDRFEYTGRGIELFLGFVFAVLVLAALGGGLWAIQHFAGSDALPFGLGLLDTFSVAIAVVGIPLLYVGQYSGLRYRLSHTRWRGIRCGLAGSSWRYGAQALFLNIANAMSAQLLTPVVSVNLARPRIANAGLGTLRFTFAGSAGDIYKRYVGYYFLNILAWVLAIGIGVAIAWGFFAESFGSIEQLPKEIAKPTARTVMVLILAAFLLYAVFSVLILPLRCWWQAYLFRHLVERTRHGHVLFASSITTRQMWGFMVLNYLIVVLTFGLGWPWVMHRTLKLIASKLWIYGAPDGGAIRQPGDHGPGYGEGLLDMFDVAGV